MHKGNAAMAPYLKKPALDPVWPPKGYQKKVEVTDADDWWILAAVHGRSDPWDLIVYNFQTRNADEVNWCLHHLVGCRRTTKDGKNYDFGKPCTQKQYVYIPPASWTPPTSEDEDAWLLVSRTLNSSSVKGMHVSLAGLGLSMSAHDFAKIGYLVNVRRIDVRLQRSHPHAAEYVPETDTMILSTLGESAVDRSMIVHEAVHASFDYRRSQGVYTGMIQEECFAYVVQMVYLQKVRGSTWPSSWKDFDAHDTWKAAWVIASKIRTNAQVTKEDIDNLRAAYQDSSAGRGISPDRRTNHNGIY